MAKRSFPILDSTLSMLAGGYAWLPGLRRRTPGPLVRTRVMGRPAVGLRGPESVRFFYDERHVRRQGAMPLPVQGTLIGRGAVHTLDGAAHRDRKAMHMSLLASPERVSELVEHVCADWDDAALRWPGPEPVILFDEVARMLTVAVCRWAGVPLGREHSAEPAADLAAMVDGFATLGPRHWRARRGRGRWERWLKEHMGDAPPGSVAGTVARLSPSPQLAAVELLNILRPVVAVSWYVVFAAHALHRWPRCRERMAEPDFAEAFAQEVRRFYPFAPFVGGKAAANLSWLGEEIPEGAIVLLDVYGQHHDETLWERPYAFEPERFLGTTARRDDLIPQGGGDPHTGHRCPGEPITVSILKALAVRLARMDYTVPPQDLTISLRRVPARPRSGFVMTGVRPAEAEAAPRIAQSANTSD